MQANWTNGPEVRQRNNCQSGLESYQTFAASKRRTRPSLVAHAPARLYRIDHVDKRRVPVHRLATTRTVFNIPLDSRGVASAWEQFARADTLVYIDLPLKLA